jgi:hypothetical protein
MSRFSRLFSNHSSATKCWKPGEWRSHTIFSTAAGRSRARFEVPDHQCRLSQEPPHPKVDMAHRFFLAMNQGGPNNGQQDRCIPANATCPRWKQRPVPMTNTTDQSSRSGFASSTPVISPAIGTMPNATGGIYQIKM